MELQPNATVGHVKGATPAPDPLDSTVSAIKPLHLATIIHPQTLGGRYEIIELLGHGGMGVVFKARDRTLNRLVACKTLRSGRFAQKEEIERFFNEARAVAQFRHPHIVGIFEMGQEDNVPYFTMEYVAGGTLADRREAYANRPREVVEMVEKIARAVHYAHERKILHRDLKPANILIDETGEPRISDFGLVKFLDSELEMTQRGQAIGTLPYMSPEQVSGQPTLCPAADIWSLGVILSEMLTGERPFQDANALELRRRICEETPTRLLRPAFDADLETIVLRCLEKQPAHRYSSAADLADDLRAWLDGKPIKARPLSITARIQRQVRRRPRRWLIASALLLLTVLALLLVRPRDPQLGLHQMQVDLKRGQPAVLIGATGSPAHSTIIYGGGRSTAQATRDGYFTVSSWETCLVELTPDPGVDRFRFRAQVWHTQANKTYPVGIYWGGYKQSLKEGDALFFAKLSFSDLFDAPAELAAHALAAGNPPPEGNVVQMKAHLLAPGATETMAIFAAPPTLYMPPVRGQQAWRQLEVDVTPELVRTCWEGKPMSGSEVRLALLNREATTMLDWHSKLNIASATIAGVSASFQPRQSLGLFVQQGAAKFRNVVIEPLHP